MESAGSYLVVGWVANKREVNKKTQYLVRNPPPGASIPCLPADPRLVHVILLTILTLGAGVRFDSHFWTQSGAPSPYLAFRAPPRFQAIYVVESVPRVHPIFGPQSAPPLTSYIWC